MLPSVVFTHLNDAMRAACRPDPVRIAWWLQAASSSALQQPRPSVTTAAPGASQCLAPRAISRLRKPLTGASFSLRGRPSGLVETAATKGLVPAAPRPRLPPQRTPPR